MFFSVAHAALACLAVLSTPASCVLPERKAELHTGERGEPGVNEEEQYGREQDENVGFPTDSVSGSKFIAGVPRLNKTEVISLREGKGVDTASFGESADAQVVIVMMSDQTSAADLESICAVPPEGCRSISPPGGGYLPWFTFIGNTSDVVGMINVANVSADANVVLTEYVPTNEIEPGEVGVDSGDGSTPWSLLRMGADERGAHAGRGIKIYLLDSGVNVDHNEFNGRATPVYDFWDEQDCNGDRRCAPDESGHGTMCASLAAGQTVGVAPGARVMSLKVCGRRICPHGYEAYAWLYGNHYGNHDSSPAVASLSYGTWTSSESQVKLFNYVSSTGIIIVNSAGNERVRPCWKGGAIHPKVISVGAIDSKGVMSYYSNFGKCIEIWAPADQLRSASHLDNASFKYRYWGGTSSACPHVAGAVALILELNPSATHSEVLGEMISLGEEDTISSKLPSLGNNLVVSSRRLPGLVSSTPV